MSTSTRIHRPLYRVYHLTPTGGIERADILEAIDDDNAVAIVRSMAMSHACELWDRARFVAKVEPPPSALVKTPVVVRRDPVERPTVSEDPVPTHVVHH